MHLNRSERMTALVEDEAACLHVHNTCSPPPLWATFNTVPGVWTQHTSIQSHHQTSPYRAYGWTAQALPDTTSLQGLTRSTGHLHTHLNPMLCTQLAPPMHLLAWTVPAQPVNHDVSDTFSPPKNQHINISQPVSQVSHFTNHAPTAAMLTSKAYRNKAVPYNHSAGTHVLRQSHGKTIALPRQRRQTIMSMSKVPAAHHRQCCCPTAGEQQATCYGADNLAAASAVPSHPLKTNQV